jgi:hypothetical protein
MEASIPTPVPKNRSLFSEKIPRTIINDILKFFKFDSINDTRVFTLKNLQPSLFEPALALIEPYYIPCKARTYLHGQLTSNRILTILRQILREEGYMLVSKEKTTNGIKAMHYQIAALTSEQTVVEFN